MLPSAITSHSDKEIYLLIILIVLTSRNGLVSWKCFSVIIISMWVYKMFEVEVDSNTFSTAGIRRNLQPGETSILWYRAWTAISVRSQACFFCLSSIKHIVCYYQHRQVDNSCCMIFINDHIYQVFRGFIFYKGFRA